MEGGMKGGYEGQKDKGSIQLQDREIEKEGRKVVVNDHL